MYIVDFKFGIKLHFLKILSNLLPLFLPHPTVFSLFSFYLHLVISGFLLSPDTALMISYKFLTLSSGFHMRQFSEVAIPLFY